ncbi:hypothetical protein [Alysiella crassa]|nr:hypothetical protein [Alysiella crassa]
MCKFTFRLPILTTTQDSLKHKMVFLQPFLGCLNIYFVNKISYSV